MVNNDEWKITAINYVRSNWRKLNTAHSRPNSLEVPKFLHTEGMTSIPGDLRRLRLSTLDLTSVVEKTWFHIPFPMNSSFVMEDRILSCLLDDLIDCCFASSIPIEDLKSVVCGSLPCTISSKKHLAWFRIAWVPVTMLLTSSIKIKGAGGAIWDLIWSTNFQYPSEFPALHSSMSLSHQFIFTAASWEVMLELMHDCSVNTWLMRERFILGKRVKSTLLVKVVRGPCQRQIIMLTDSVCLRNAESWKRDVQWPNSHLIINLLLTWFADE